MRSSVAHHADCYGRRIEAHDEASAPTGVVAFLFTDVVGSTRAWAEHPKAMDRDLAIHDGLTRSAVADAGGYVFYAAGDSFGAAFASVRSAVDAAIDAQRALSAADWRLPGGLTVRMGIHVGEAVERDGDYFGTPVNLAARLMSAAHGGQIVLSGPAVQLIEGVELSDLGPVRLRDVEQELDVAQVVAEGLAREFPPLRTEDTQLSNLPRYRSSFVGRQAEIDRIRTLLAGHSLVTVTGVGGAGKTRVAVEVAAAELPDLDGAFFVDLQSIDDPDRLASAFTAAMEVVPAAGADVVSELVRFFRERRVLLVVDNCEHLLDEVAELVDDLLQSSPSLRVLATSREALEIEGEETFRLPPLSAGESGLRLFVERARAVDDSFSLDTSGREEAIELCRRLDGMPLAIELAAGRVRTSTPAELLAGLDDRFALLRAGRRRGVMARQRTLEAAIEWSYDLLEPDEQRFFRSLGVFSGPFTMDLVPTVTGVSRARALDLLDSLAAKSLVATAPSPGGGTHARLLETLRAFAVDRLADAGEVDEVRARHLDAAVDAFAVELMRGIWSGALHAAYRLQSQEVVSAAEHAMSIGRPDLAVRLILVGGYSLVGHGDFGGFERVVDRLRDEYFDDLSREYQAQLLGVYAGTQMVSGNSVGSFETAMSGIAEYADTSLESRYLLHNCGLILAAASGPRHARRLLTSISEEYRPGAPPGTPLRDVTGGLLDHETSILAAERRYVDALRHVMKRHSRDPRDWRSPIDVGQEGWLRVVVDELADIDVVQGDDGWWFAGCIGLEMCRPTEIDRRAAAVVAVADRLWHGRLAGEEAEYLTAFAWLAHQRGENERALELLDVCVIRSPWITWPMVEVYSAVEEWPGDEWASRRQHMILSRLGRDWAEAHRDRATHLLRAELERWRSPT